MNKLEEARSIAIKLGFSEPTNVKEGNEFVRSARWLIDYLTTIEKVVEEQKAAIEQNEHEVLDDKSDNPIPDAMRLFNDDDFKEMLEKLHRAIEGEG